MGKKSVFIFVALSLLLTACKTSFRISVRNPPEILLADSTKRFLLVNNVTNENSPDELLDQVIKGQQYNGNVLASEQSINGILRSLDDSRYLKGTPRAPLQFRKNMETDWNIVDSACRNSGVQGIIEIASFESKAPVGGTVLANVAGQSASPLKGWIYFNVYIANTHQHLDRLSLSEVYNIPVSGTLNPLNMLSDMVRKREVYGQMGYNIGYRTGSLFYSNWFWVNRSYYTKGSTNLKRAKRLIRSGNWDLAERQLTADINSPKNKVAGRAKFNMALIYEGQGRLDDAVMMAERAAFENGTKPAYDYINVLKNRITRRSTFDLSGTEK